MRPFDGQPEKSPYPTALGGIDTFTVRELRSQLNVAALEPPGMSGYRATVVVEDPAVCPVADASAQTTAPIDSVVQAQPTPDGRVVEQFTVQSTGSTDSVVGEDRSETAIEPVQTTDRETVYRFDRERTVDCPCELVERTGTPVSSVRARDGALLLTIVIPDLEAVTTIVETLRDQFDGVALEELTANDEQMTTDPIVVDRARLTDRQREVVETAYEMGYFEYPKRANATDVAAELDVARSTFTEHVAAAQTKLLTSLLQK